MNRTQSIISFAAVILAYLCSHAGIVIDESVLIEAITALVGLAAVIWGCWKNHNVTKAAEIAQGWINDMKSGRWPRG